VDAVIFFDEDTPLELIRLVKPDVLVKGADYKEDDVVGADFVKNNAGQIMLIPFVEGYSSTATIEKIKKL
jgi:bifunctional ADP-heptose synthase (sugar kinase/adenylyltransferase)